MSPSGGATADLLDMLLPQLIGVWRTHFKISGPPAQLRPTETGRIAQSLAELSHGLTRDRAWAGRDYFHDPYLFGAYLFFFWPVSFVQARYVLDRLSRPGRSLLELGAASAPMSLAAASKGITRLLALDRSPDALAIGKNLLRLRNQPLATRLWTGRKPDLSSKTTFDLITFQHVLNELWPGHPDREAKILHLLTTFRNHLSSQGRIVIIEPALTETSRSLLRIRDGLISRGYHIEAPCATQAVCPALTRPTDSCHVDWPWSPPALIRQLARQSGIKKHDLKMTYLVVQPAPSAGFLPWGPDVFRIVSEPMLSKNGRHRLIACGEQGRLGLALHPRDQSPSNRIFLSLKRGDLIRLETYDPVEAGIRLLPATQIHRLNQPDGCSL